MPRLPRNRGILREGPPRPSPTPSRPRRLRKGEATTPASPRGRGGPTAPCRRYRPRRHSPPPHQEGGGGRRPHRIRTSVPTRLSNLDLVGGKSQSNRDRNRRALP